MSSSIDICKLYKNLRPKENGPDSYVHDLIGEIATLISKVDDKYNGKLYADAFCLCYLLKRQGKNQSHLIGYFTEGRNVAIDDTPEGKKVKEACDELKKRIENKPTVKTWVENTINVVSHIDTKKAVYLYHIRKLFELSNQDRDISLGELVYIKDRMEKWIVNAKNEFTEVENDQDSIDKIKAKEGLPEIFIRELVELSYEDGCCDKAELDFIKKTAEECLDVEERERFLESIVMEFDRIKYSSIERLEKGYWNVKEHNKVEDFFIKFFINPFKILWNFISFFVVGSSFGRVLGACLIVILGIYVYVYATGDQVWDAIIESTSSFFRSYGGYNGERNSVKNDAQPIYYIFQYLVLSFVLVVTFFHFGKDFANDTKRKFYVFLRTKFRWKSVRDWCTENTTTSACLCAVFVVVFTLFFLPKHDVRNPEYSKQVYSQIGSNENTHILVDVYIPSNKFKASNTSEGLEISIVPDMKNDSVEIVTNSNSFVPVRVLKKCLDDLKLPALDVMNRHIATIVMKSNAWNKISGAAVSSDKCLGKIMLNRQIPVDPVTSKLKRSLAAICVFILCGYGFCSACIFLCFCFRRYKALKRNLRLYVIWGGVDEHGVKDSCLALMADIKRSKEGTAVMVMIDKDTIPKDRYSEVSEYLRPFPICWKYVSYSKLEKYDAVGDYHFFISDKGRENRVMAQSVMERFRNDNENRSRMMNINKDKRPSLFVQVKHSTSFDLNDWLNDPVVKENFDLQIFRVADLVCESFWRQKHLADMERRCLNTDEAQQTNTKRSFLFLGMDTKGRSILKSLFPEKEKEKKKDILSVKHVHVTIWEQKVENRQRCLLYLLDLLRRPNVFDKVSNLQLSKIGGKGDREEVESGSLSSIEIKMVDWKEDYPTNFSFEFAGQKWTFDFLGITPTVFKAWMYKNMFVLSDKDNGKDKFSFDYVVSCLGGAHDSLTVMRRMERIFYQRRKDFSQSLPVNKYFMQLEDTRYASMYEKKVNHEVTVFGDLRRVFTLGMIKKCAEGWQDCDRRSGIV